MYPSITFERLRFPIYPSCISSIPKQNEEQISTSCQKINSRTIDFHRLRNRHSYCLLATNKVISHRDSISKRWLSGRSPALTGTFVVARLISLA